MSGLSTLLVFGRKGQVAQELLRLGAAAGIEVTALGRESLDIGDAEAVARAVAASSAPVVINAAAWTAVDKAEGEKDAAMAVNRDGPAHIAAACAASGRALLHISTDYVFSAHDPGRPWREDDPVGPVNVYGASKLAGEQAIAAVLPRHAIVRTSWVFASHGQNFVRTMLRLARQRDTLSVVADQHGCPTPAEDLAAALLTMAGGFAAGTATPGIFHYCGAGATTWFGFAEAIFAEAAAQGLKVPTTLNPIATADWPTPATRPLMSILDCSRIQSTWGITPRSWRLALPGCIRALNAADTEETCA